MWNSAGHAGCRSGEGDANKLSTLASELVRARVDILVARLTPAVLAASRAKQTIPIVMAGAGDPIGNRIVDSLARPGRNITGAGIAGQLSGKLVELARDVTPSTREIAVLAETTFQRLSISATRLRSVRVQPTLPRAAVAAFASPEKSEVDTQLTQVLEKNHYSIVSSARARRAAGTLRPRR